MIEIKEPLFLTEIGRKDNQEDYLFPASPTKDDRVFILCDGMGGHEKGEVASKTVAETLGSTLSKFSNVGPSEFDNCLNKAYDALDLVEFNSSDRKPGTTMTCLCLNNRTCLVAHIGDSRIYHIRPTLFNKETKEGGILYQSSDHSLVNNLLKLGEITEEEAKNFSHKNIITKAMQPALEVRPKADVFVLDDVAKGDYFFLCSDGVLENLSNERLCEILADESLNDNQKFAEIKKTCFGNTFDNFSCWLIPVADVDFKNKPSQKNLTKNQSIKRDVALHENTANKNSSGLKLFFTWFIISFLVFLLIYFALIYLI